MRDFSFVVPPDVSDQHPGIKNIRSNTDHGLTSTRILHFTLFVRACVETSRQNNQTRTLVIIVPGYQPGSVYVVVSGKVPQPYAAQLQHGGSTEVSDRVVELPRAHATIQ